MAIFTVGAGPKQEQSKTVTSAISAFTVTPDAMYALSSVIVNAMPSEEKTVTSSGSVQTVTPTINKLLSKVTVNAMPATTAVNTTISTVAQSVAIPAAYYSSAGAVSILSTEQAKIIAANIKTGVTILGVAGSVPVQKPEQTKSTTSSISAQTVTPDSGYVLTSVSIAAMPSETKTATPTAAGFTVTPTAGKLLSSVVVSGDANLVAAKIVLGNTIFGVAGNMRPGVWGA